MAFDKSKLIEHFRKEVKEHIQGLSDGLLKLEKDPDERDVVEALMREAHTIKGSAAMMGFRKISEIAHGMEDGLEKALRGEARIERPGFDVLFKCLDSMEPLLDTPPGEEEPKLLEEVDTLCREVSEVFAGGGLPGVPDGGEGVPDAGEDGRPQESPAIEGDDPCDPPKAVESAETKPAEPVESQPPPKAVPAANAAGTPAPSGARRAKSGPVTGGSLRVDVERLDTLMNLSGELGIARLRLRELVREMSTRIDADRGPAEGVGEILEGLTRVGEQIDSLTSALQEETMDVRMIPVSYLFNTFPRAMRDLAAQRNKRIEFVIRGEETRLDKSIINEMKDPLMHLLRNAVDHGIEDAEERERVGKPEMARIVMSAEPVGSRVEIEVMDDGRGIDVARIREKAVERGLVTEEEAGGMPDERAYALLFTPSFTTKDVVTEVSGRGVGLDVVQEQITKLKGAVEIESEPGCGTRFIMRLPLTLAITNSLLVACGSETFALPVEHVVETIRIGSDDIDRVGTRERISVRDEILPLLRLNDVFGLPGRGILQRRYEHAIIVQAPARRYALVVDRLIGHQEIMRKALGPPLRNIPHIAGATILGSGRVVLILDLLSLIAVPESPAGAAVPSPRAEPGKDARRTILVAEDSLSTAAMEKNILESAGYDVVLAHDGREALERFQEGAFDLVITDLLMPRMDGIELTTRLKGGAASREVPVIIVTTRGGDRDRRRGMEAGADAYMLKSEFTSDELLDRIEGLIG